MGRYRGAITGWAFRASFFLPVLMCYIPIHKPLYQTFSAWSSRNPWLPTDLDFQDSSLSLRTTTCSHGFACLQGSKPLQSKLPITTKCLEEVSDSLTTSRDLPSRLAGLGVYGQCPPETVKTEAKPSLQSNNEHGVAAAIKEYVLGWSLRNGRNWKLIFIKTTLKRWFFYQSSITPPVS